MDSKQRSPNARGGEDAAAPSAHPLRLFFEMFAIASLVMGGGFAILAAAESRFARKLKWLREGELTDMLPVFSLVPGIIAGHTAVYLGNRLCGLGGSVAALAGTVLPSVIVFTAVSAGYDVIPVGNACLAAAFRGLRAALAGILVAMTVRKWKSSVGDAFGLALFAASCALMLAGAAPYAVILGAMSLGLIVTFARDRAARAAASPAQPKSPSDPTPASCPDANTPHSQRFQSFWAIPLVFLGYGLVAFGGGYTLVPVYIRNFVGETAAYLQLAPHDFANVMALTQMTPGPIGINCATYFGYRLGGIPGAVAATVALILPGFLILRLALASLDRFRENVLVRGIFRGIAPVTKSLLAVTSLAFLKLALWPHGFGALPPPLETALVILAAALTLTRRLGVVPLILLSSAAALLFR